jgi:hypothetical protein
MEGNGSIFWRLVLVAVVAFFAIKLIFWLLGTVLSILKIGIAVAVVVGIVWLLIQIFGKKTAYN